MNVLCHTAEGKGRAGRRYTQPPKDTPDIPHIDDPVPLSGTVSRMDTNPRTRALDHLAAVRAANAAIRDLEQQGAHGSAQDLRRANADLGVGLKMAEVEALLYVGDQVAGLLRHAAGHRPCDAGEAEFLEGLDRRAGDRAGLLERLDERAAR